MRERMWICANFGGVLTFEQCKVRFSEAIKGIVSRGKDGVGAFLLQQISQTCCLHQREENPTFIQTKSKKGNKKLINIAGVK